MAWGNDTLCSTRMEVRMASTSMQYQGKSKQEAVNMAAISTKGRIQVQATLSAVKEMAGWTLYACLFCMIFVVVLPYPKRKLLT